MEIENTDANRKLAQVIASMSIENMYVDKEFVKELIKVSNGEKTTEELRQEIIKKYTQK